MVATKERKLRRQTMMPRKTATTVSSPSLSLRRTRRQSMMPVKLRDSPVPEPPKSRGTRTKPPALPRGESATQAKSKRKLAEDIVTLEASPAKRRKVTASKSTTQVKTPPSPPPARKQKSLSALPVSRSTRQAPKAKTSPARKPPAPSESSRRKTPARKRALSPVAPSPGKGTPSPPKRRATSRSKSESRLPRGKSLTRSQKTQKSKSAGQIKSPVTKVQPASPRVKASRKTTPQARKTATAPVTPPASPPPRSARRSVKKVTKTSSKALSTPARSPASDKKTKTPPSTKKTLTPSKKKTPVAKTPLSTKKTPTLSKKKTPIAKTPPSTKKTPTLSKKKTPVAKTPPSTKKTPTLSKKKTPVAKTPPSTKKTPTAAKTPKDTPTSQRKTKKTPVVVLKNIKSPVVKPQISGKKPVSVKVVSPRSASPQRRRLVRSTAKSHMTKSLKVVVSGKSPPSSLASFRKTPSSKRAPAVSPPEDLGASPELPSAHKQLERIRVNIATARERRKSASATPRKALSRTTPMTPKTKLDKVVTQADVHATASNKANTEATLVNHCDSALSTPSARPPLPPTPKSSRNSNVRVCHFSSSITSSSTSVKHLRKVAAPHSSTPLKGRQALDVLDGTTLSEAMDDSLDGRGAETSLESMNGVGEDTTMDHTVQEPAEPEPPTQSRKSFCSLM